jgi:L-rhamnose mutarotase
VTRHCFLLDLINDAALIAAYRAWHAPGRVPAAVISSIRDRGIESMEIWHAGDRLFMIVEQRDAVARNSPPGIEADHPDVAAWEQLMDRFQRRMRFAAADVKWFEMERIFNLADH